MDYRKYQAWAPGRRSELACVTFVEYEDGYIVASAEMERLTEGQFAKAVKKVKPGILFFYEESRGYHCARTQ